MHRRLTRGVSTASLLAAAAAIATLFPMPALSAWGASTLSIPGQDYDYTSTTEGESGLISSNSMTQFLLDDDDEGDDDDRDEDEDDERDEDEDDKDDDNERDGHDDDRDDEKDDDDDRKHKDKNDHKEGKDHPPKKHHGHGDDPLARDQTVSTEEDTDIKIQLQANSFKPGELSFSIVDEPRHGKLRELDSSKGTVIYDPSPDFFGQDSFSFKATDSDGDSHSAKVTINVGGVNDPPVATGSEVVTREGRSVSILLRASDADGDDLTYIIMSDPAHGKQTGIPPNLTYSPNNRFHGSDSITFKVTDGKAQSNPAIIQITVKADRDNDRNDNDRWWEETPKSPPSSTSSPAQSNGGLTPDNSDDNSNAITPVYGSPGGDTLIPVDSPLPAIRDLLAPRLIFSASTIEAIAQSYAGAIVTYSVRATDETDGEVAPSCSPSSGTKFPIGRFNVVCYATDAAGNSALSSFVVVVREAVAGENSLPAFVIPAVIASVLGAAGYFGFRFMKLPPSGR